MKDKKAIPTLTDKEFKELLKSWGVKAMESFEINELFNYTQKQKNILKKENKNEKN